MGEKGGIEKKRELGKEGRLEGYMCSLRLIDNENDHESGREGAEGESE